MSALLSQSLPWDQANRLWASALNPIIASPLSSAQLLTNIALGAGVNTTINHGLGRQMLGWFLTDINASSVIYRAQPLNDKTLTLSSTEAVTISIGVF